MELVANGSLLFDMLVVHANDEIVSRPDPSEVGMVAVTEEELATCRGVGSHTPTARFVTVVFLHQLIDGSGDGAKDAELRNIRTEP